MTENMCNVHSVDMTGSQMLWCKVCQQDISYLKNQSRERLFFRKGYKIIKALTKTTFHAVADAIFDMQFVQLVRHNMYFFKCGRYFTLRGGAQSPNGNSGGAIVPIFVAKNLHKSNKYIQGIFYFTEICKKSIKFKINRLYTLYKQ